MRIGSCFSGVGGLDLGVEAAGLGRLAFCVEWQVFQTRVLDRHWPGAKKFRDIEAITGREVPKVDILVGGFPCTGFSKAGKGMGLRNEQSHRWFDMLRIIEAQRPVGVLLENVRALLRDRFAHDLATIYEGLRALGYTVDAPLAIDSFELGAPHHRERVFLVATRGTVHASAFEAVRPPLVESVKDLYPAPRGMPPKPGEPPRTLVKHQRYPHKESRLLSLGNAVVPDMGREAALHLRKRLLGEPPLTEPRLPNIDRTAPPLGYRAPARFWPTAITTDAKGSRRATARADHWTSNEGESLTDAVWLNDPADYDRPLNPDWSEALMGFPRGWTLPE